MFIHIYIYKYQIYIYIKAINSKPAEHTNRVHNCTVKASFIENGVKYYQLSL